jgi:hypothetical protein
MSHFPQSILSSNSDNYSYYSGDSTTVTAGTVDGNHGIDIFSKNDNVSTDEPCETCRGLPHQVIIRQNPQNPEEPRATVQSACSMSARDVLLLLQDAEKDLNESDKPVEPAILHIIKKTAGFIAEGQAKE